MKKAPRSGAFFKYQSQGLHLLGAYFLDASTRLYP